MRRGLQLVVASVCVLVLSGFVAGLVASPAKSLGAPPPVPASSGTSPKVHVAEVLTGVWCPPCGTADPALSRIQDEWGDNLIEIAYHCCAVSGPNADPFWDTNVLGPRNTFYQWNFLPSVIIDGGGTYGNEDPLFLIGSSGTTGSTYDMYRFAFEDSADTTSNVAVSISGDLTPSTAVATVTVTATDAVPQTNLYLRTVLYEDGLYYTQANGVPVHRNVARALNEQLLGATGTMTQGQTITTTVTFPLNPAWKMNKLGVAAFVQSNTKRAITITVNSTPYPYSVSDVLNAAKHNFVQPSVLVYRDSGTVANYQEVLEIILAQQGETYDTWNTHELGFETGTTDNKALPTAADLASKAPVLFWNTGASTSPVLTQAERDLIATYLDRSPGDLLLTGSGIGFDGWTQYRAWFQQYLHAIYESDDTGATYVNGVAGDPISGPFATTNLNILSSPDRINAIAQPNSAVPFVYPGGLPGSVRSQHDADSRIVYLGFQYFENTIDTNRGRVLSAILNWTDGAAPPTVRVNTPQFCQVVAPGATFPIRWTATDVRIPANGVDLYYSTDSGGSWTPIAMGEPNDGVYNWMVPAITTSTARIRVIVHDSQAQMTTTMTPSDFTISSSTTGVTCNMQFTNADVGWHLVSFPLIPANPSAAAILSSLGGSYDVARAYVYDPADPWKALVPAKTGNDLAQLDQTMAFWIEITGPGTLSVTGNVPTTQQSIVLHRGWNMVGFPSYRYGYTIADLKTATGATRVEGFDDAATPYYLRVLSDTTLMQPGAGYWVYVPVTTTWAVPL